MRREHSCRPSFAVAVAALAAACTRVEPQRTVAADSTEAGIPAVVHAHLDSAETAWQNGDYAFARAHYRIVRDSVPDPAAAWFGLYLTERALGATAAADSALRMARRLAATTADSTARPRS